MDWMEQNRNVGFTSLPLRPPAYGTATESILLIPLGTWTYVEGGTLTESSFHGFRHGFSVPRWRRAPFRTVWRQADKYRFSRMAYVNKMILWAPISTGGRYDERRLKCTRCPIQLLSRGRHLHRMIDLVEMKAYVYYDDIGKRSREEEIPADLKKG